MNVVHALPIVMEIVSVIVAEHVLVTLDGLDYLVILELALLLVPHLLDILVVIMVLVYVNPDLMA